MTGRNFVHSDINLVNPCRSHVLMKRHPEIRQGTYMTYPSRGLTDNDGDADNRICPSRRRTQPGRDLELSCRLDTSMLIDHGDDTGKSFDLVPSL